MIERHILMALPNVPSFPVHENNAETRWRKWISRLENLFIGLDIKDKQRQRLAYEECLVLLHAFSYVSIRVSNISFASSPA
jgi:hypothetical protein